MIVSHVDTQAMVTGAQKPSSLVIARHQKLKHSITTSYPWNHSFMLKVKKTLAKLRIDYKAL
jgi:hypothetical protein